MTTLSPQQGAGSYETIEQFQRRTAYRPIARVNPDHARDILATFDLDARSVVAAAEIVREAEEEAAKLIEAAKERADAIEAEFLRNVARRLDTGTLNQREVAEIFPAYRTLARTGYGSRWDEVVPLTRVMIEYEKFFDPDPDGRWRGPWPIERGQSVPLPGTPVVYHLYDEVGECCYIGSTSNLAARLKMHRSDGKDFRSWMAERHESREAAYAAEAALLQASLPYLNRKAGR